MRDIHGCEETLRLDLIGLNSLHATANATVTDRAKGTQDLRMRAALRTKLWRGPIERYELPDLHGLNFVFHDALEGGVNASLNLDFHGNSFSYLLLGLTVEVER